MLKNIMIKETVTFIQAKGLPASEWDKKNRKPLYSFQRRVFTTDDPNVIELLDKRGYPRQQVVEHWTIPARKTLEARGVSKERISEIFKTLTDAGLKIIESGKPVITPITGNVHGAATLNPIVDKSESPPPEGGLDRLDLDV